MELKLTSTLVLLAALAPVCFHWTQLAQAQPLASQTKSSPTTDHGSLVSVQTSSGLLNGLRQSTAGELADTGAGNLSAVLKFLAVPYAEPPTGQLRFQRPVELHDRSDSIVDASKFGRTCPQYRHLTRFISPLLNIDEHHLTSEDCLHLNVFVPGSVGSIVKSEGNRLEPDKQLPVIVWIPGEGFDFADARQFDGSHLAQRTQSIVVTVQYRVGVLGFLQASKLGAPGNMGILDQLMALRWVRKNIGNFGGDAERVSVMGRFSGSMSISSMITAPKQELIRAADGQQLFSRAILLSGVAVSDWIIDSHQGQRVQALETAAVARGFCTKEQVRDDSCLQVIPVDQLISVADYGWRLSVDNELVGQVAPIEAVKRNQLASQLDAVLLGETAMEGTLCLYRHVLQSHSNNYAQLIEDDKLTPNDLYEIIRDDSLTYFGYNLTDSNPIQTALETMLLDDSSADEQQQQQQRQLRDKYLNACSSYMVKSHSNRLKRNILSLNQLEEHRKDMRKKPVDVFHYELKYKPTFSLAPDYIKSAAHGDDIPLIFGLVYNQPRREVSETDLLMTRRMMAYIGNFVHGNNPLLSQHATIDAKVPQDQARASRAYTLNMDDYDLQAELNQTGQLVAPIKRSWSSEGQTHSMELNEEEARELAARTLTGHAAGRAGKLPAAGDNTNDSGLARPNVQQRTLSTGGGSFKLIVVERANNNNADVNYTQDDQLEAQASRPQRNLDSYRRQQLIDDDYQANLVLFQGIRRAALAGLTQQHHHHQTSGTGQQTVPAQPTNLALINESSFMTMMLFGCCVVIITLMSLCLGLCLVIFRSNLATDTKKVQYFARSSSSCNICDDSQASASIDVVLANNRKDAHRGFGNMFAKLRNQNANQVTSTNMGAQCTSGAAAARQHSVAVHSPAAHMAALQQQQQQQRVDEPTS